MHRKIVPTPIQILWRLRHNTGSVDHDADQHHRGHDVGALGRDFGARQHQIERRGGKRGERRPFLDRMAKRQGGKQRQHGAHEEEHHAGDKRHVIPGD
jgi:hypothetical protein